MATETEIVKGSALPGIKIIVLLSVAATLPTQWINLNSFLIILLSTIWLLDLIINKRKPHYNFTILILFISFYLFTVISLLYSFDSKSVLAKMETRLVIIVFPLMLLGSSDIDEKVLKLILKTFLVSCISISLLCIGHTFYKNYANGNVYQASNNWLFSSDNLIERFGFHPNYFSLYCAFSVFIVLFLLKEKELKVMIGFFIIVYLCVFQLLLASRVGILSFIVLFVLTVIFEAYLRKRLLLGVVIVFLFLVAIVFLGMNSQTVKDKFDALLNRNIHQYNEPFRIDRRFIQWSSAIEVFQKSPLIGVGTGDMQEELQKIYLRKNFNEGYDNRYNPHNLFLDSAASLGLLGIASNVLLFCFSFYLSFNRKNILYLQFLILFLVISLVESTFSVQKGVTFFFFFNTVFYSHLKNFRNGRGYNKSE